MMWGRVFAFVDVFFIVSALALFGLRSRKTRVPSLFFIGAGLALLVGQAMQQRTDIGAIAAGSLGIVLGVFGSVFFATQVRASRSDAHGKR